MRREHREDNPPQLRVAADNIGGGITAPWVLCAHRGIPWPRLARKNLQDMIATVPWPNDRALFIAMHFIVSSSAPRFFSLLPQALAGVGLND
jgi:hypothetical protein